MSSKSIIEDSQKTLVEMQNMYLQLRTLDGSNSPSQSSIALSGHQTELKHENLIQVLA